MLGELLVAETCAQHRRIRRAGRDRIDRYSVLGIGASEAAGHGNDAALGGCINHRTAESAGPPALRGEINDSPAAPLVLERAARSAIQEEARF